MSNKSDRWIIMGDRDSAGIRSCGCVVGIAVIGSGKDIAAISSASDGAGKGGDC